MSNIYNLATNFKQYYSMHHKKHLQQDPINHTPNIFKTIELNSLNQKKIMSSKNYQVVGIKQLKNLQMKARKGAKLSSRRQETDHQRSLSKQSPQTNKRLLTKEEVLQGLPKLKSTKNVVKIPTSLRRDTQTSSVSDFKLPSSKVKISSIKNQFSVSKLKEKMKQRQNQWSKFMRYQRATKQNGKFPTIYKSIELYRTKIQQKQKQQNTKASNSHNNSLWQQSLRNNRGHLKQQSQKSVERIIHDDSQFSARGSSKLRLQTEWIEYKDKDGYQFKLLSSEKNHGQQKIQSFR